MGSPYLSKGESITLTTHRVDVESVPYDVMLTTHRLTLIDSRYARFEPLMIAFEDILTVKSGTVSSGEPVIILTYTGADENDHTMNLIFLQQPGEHRKDERDIWVKKLMESIIAGRDRIAGTDEGTPQEPGPMKASVRRWVAPEGIELHTPSAAKETDQPGITIIPDEEGDLLEKSLQTHPAGEHRNPSVPPGSTLPEEEAGPEVPEMTGTPRTVPEYDSGITDDENEDTVSPDLPKDPGSPDNSGPEEEAGPEAPDMNETSRTVPEYVYGITEDENEDTFTPDRSEDTDPLQKFQTIVIPFASLEKPDNNSGSGGKTAGEEPRQVSEDLILAGARSFARKEPAGDGTGQAPEADAQAGPDSLSLADAGTPADAVPGTSQAEEDARIDDGVRTAGERDHAGSSASKTAHSREPPPEEQATGRKEPGSSGKTGAGRPGVVTALLILIAVLVMAAIGVIVLNYSGNLGADQGPSALPAVTETRAESPLVLAIPASGAGFRVTYDGDFAGNVGNPAQLKPVAGNGDIFFPVKEYNGIVQASIQKRDNSGKTLTIEVYNNAKMIYSRNVSTPAGSLDILLDTRTGTIAGMTPAKPVTNQTVQTRPLYF